MSLIAAIVGSLTAIAIATLIYAWQKGIDRHSALIAERRTAYARYLTQCAKSLHELIEASGTAEHEELDRNLYLITSHLTAELHLLLFISSDDVIERVNSHWAAFSALVAAVDKHTKSTDKREGFNALAEDLRMERDRFYDLANAMSSEAIRDASPRSVSGALSNARANLPQRWKQS